MTQFKIAWWNLENCFDHARAARSSELKEQLKDELIGWTASVRNRKLDQLASIVQEMFNGEGPDLLGICEIENEHVAELFKERLNFNGRDYRVLNHESHDARGIDVSFIYDHNIITVNSSGHQVVHKRTGTRDIFWGEFMIIETRATFIAIGNHWPARTMGRYETEPSRILSAETASYVISRLYRDSDRGNRLPVLVMGDFNDEPYNRSLIESLFGMRDIQRVRRGQLPYLYNLMWQLVVGNEPGTYKYGSDWYLLDQFLVNKGMLLNTADVQVLRDSVQIFRSPRMTGRGGAPIRYGRPSKNSLNRDGFSDHFPITMLIESR